MTYRQRMEDKLRAAFAPVHLAIADDSARHAGHAGAREGGETHFKVLVVSDAFAGQSRVQRQRAVYSVLAAEIQERVHALELRALTPAEHRTQIA